MEVVPNQILEGPVLLAPVAHGDERGFFVETFRASTLAGLGIDATWVQDNHSRSARGVVRGMHLHGDAEGVAKLVRVARGEIFDVAVDLRRASETYGRWEGFVLSEENLHMLYVPPGFGHGFCVCSDVADVLYKQSRYYDPDVEVGFAFDDPDVGIEWPAGELLASPRDAAAPRLAQIADRLPF